MSTSSIGKGRGFARARDPGDDNATEHAKHFIPHQEEERMEQLMFKLNEFLSEIVKEVYPFLSPSKIKYIEIEDMLFEKSVDWLENPRENASYSESKLEIHNKLWSVMITNKEGAPKEHSFVDWCRKAALHRKNAANNAATEHADPFRIMVEDIVANNLTPAQRKNPKYKLREGKAISSQLRSLVNVLLRKNLGDAKVAFYIFESGIPTLLDADMLKRCSLGGCLDLPLQSKDIETMLEELMRWHASLLQWLDERQNHPNTIMARKLSDPNEKNWQEWRRREKLHLEQELRHGLYLANLREWGVKRVHDMSAEEQRVLEDHDNGKLRKRYDGVRIRKHQKIVT